MARGILAVAADAPDLHLVVGDIRDLACASRRFDLVVYDVLGLYRGGAEALRAVLSHHPGTRVLALTRDLRPDLSTKALQHGIHGAVSLHASREEIVAAIRHAATSTAVVTMPVRPRRSAAGDPDASALSRRERDVLELIAAGYSNAEISERLYLSINSVKTFIRAAYRRIGVTSRTQAVVWAVSHGLGPVEVAPELARHG